MKKIGYITILLLVTTFCAYAAQGVDKTIGFDKKMKDLLKEDTEPMFKTTEAPKAFKDESIVVLAQKVKMTFYGAGASSSCLTYIHNKILLNDISALERFSEYSFDEPSGANAIQLNIIKKNGKVVTIDLKDAVSDEVKLKLRSYNFSLSETQKKIALKNLDVGDVLDFVSLVDRWQLNYEKTYYLASEYPTVASKITFEHDKNNFLVAYKSINNCPTFKRTVAKTTISYTIEDTMRAKYEEVPDDIPSFTEPHFKMQIIASSYINKFAFKYEPNKAKTTITEDDLKRAVCKANNELEGSNSEYYIDYIEKYGYNQTDADFLKTYFYYMRDRLFTYTATFDDKPKNIGMSFMNKLIRGAQKRKIPYEIILLKDRNEGRLDDLLFENELYWAVSFTTDEGDINFYSFHQFSHPNEVPNDFEGTEAYRFKVASSVGKTVATRFTIPCADSEKNTHYAVMNVKFDKGFDSVNIDRHVVLKGYFRNNVKFDLINRNDYFHQYIQQLKEFNILTNDNLRYYFITNGAYYKADKDFLDSEELRCRELFKENQYDRIKAYFENDHRDERYEVLKYNNYKIESDSRPADSNWIEWNENLIIGNVVQNVNDKFVVVEVGKIFGGMYQINNDKQRDERTKSFFINQNRSLTNEVNIHIPKGYTVKDIKQLNVSFENNTGKFTTVAVKDGDKLNIVLTKTYKSGTYEKEKWQEFIAFLDAAATYNQTKIILEKSNTQ